ncbi:GLUG motif-containing protein [Schinkia azotoformans]|uniref:GLUG motif-containing protein n=1 Tax=Schinkia azotoformans TaxID=1454 RepID=UPI002DBFCC51|nr:GLUG motif-containing protein [Schinkia azotoformans]MEC1715921.1 GLUG motif-containing protein [Schinkia azotoformans]MEC1741560.1 GLUG motif-containing protein [Schinkia azotoformans]MEC1744554.1 GLUG motif-containing protein [Schinkia azotoformans]MEC1758455.1 GLUG motif-containing protein [Schinkia azotoformans]MEC1765257.1 GLUG motif-containing protein [Schinkia azotoformans]
MPILISTPQELDNIRNNLSGDYELVNDIDMSGFGNFTPIGNSTTKFKGVFNGKGFKIKNITINISSQNVGLFGFAENATIQNVAIENANVTSNMQNYVGILAGYTFTTTITNCYTSGQLKNGQYGVGGLVGYFGGTIENCFSHATVIGKGRVGGLVGNIIDPTSYIKKSYSTGLVTVTPDPNLFNGGLVGSGYDSSNVTDSFWDINTSGQTISAGGTGLTTSEMKTQSSYVNWDFTTVWGINSDYPYLQVFGVPVVEIPPKIETVTVNSYSNNFFGNLGKSIKSTKQTDSYIHAIQTYTDRHIATIRNIDTYILPINSYAIQSHRSVRSSTQTVISFLNPISASVERQTKTFKNLLSFVEPLQANLNVLYPLDNRMYQAVVNVIENPSSASHSENISHSYYVNNPSFSEVIE